MKLPGWTLATSTLLLSACVPHAAPTDGTMKTTAEKAAAPAAAATTPAENPFFRPSTLAWHLPPFDRIKDSSYRPAFEKGMADQLAEIDAIAHDPAAPSFDNTIVAMERSGALLIRVSKAFFNLNTSNTDDEMEKIEAEMAPKLSAHQDAIFLDAALFARVDAVYQQRAKLGLDPESAQLLDRYEKMFVRAGAKLSDADKEKLKKLNAEISTLTTQFRQNVLKATKDGAVIVDDVKQLDGLSPELISAAAEAAKARGLEGKWVVTLQNTTIQPPLELLRDRALREKIYRASVGRSVGGDADTTAIISRLVTLRAEQAKLLGYPTYAAYQLAEETAGTPQAVDQLLSQLAPAALAKAKAEAADIQKLIDQQAKASHTKAFELEPWDWAFYEGQVRKAKFEFDDSQVKPYFELNRVLQDGVFFAANKLYGITFKERKDLPVYQPDVRVFEVHDADGSPLALLLLDYFKRDNKQGGAWMDNFVDQSTLLDRRPVVVNNLNIPKPAPGQPALLTFDEVTTMFHEFGHALHGMLSNSKYPLLSGTARAARLRRVPVAVQRDVGA